jgi:hypothetical protein
MPAAAPRIPRRVLEALVRLDDRRRPIAETYRRVASEAEHLGYTRPSYEQIRFLLHRSRRIRRGPTTASILLDIATQVRPPEAMLDHVSGIGVPELRR